MYLVNTVNGRAMRVVVGDTPQEAMEFYHKAETFYLKAAAYELNQILPDGRVSELGVFVDTLKGK